MIVCGICGCKLQELLPELLVAFIAFVDSFLARGSVFRYVDTPNYSRINQAFQELAMNRMSKFEASSPGLDHILVESSRFVDMGTDYEDHQRIIQKMT